jgi:predicted DNA-binding protein YlxM (UPF0122 family)
MLEEKTFELTPVLDSETGNYVVNDYNVAKEIVADFIEREVNSITEINDELTFSSVKKTRTDIRKRKDMITQARLQINALLLGKFNEQLKEIETMLDNADKVLKGKVDKYATEVKGKENKPKVITLVCKGYNEKEIQKVREFALKHGLTAEVK